MLDHKSKVSELITHNMDILSAYYIFRAISYCAYLIKAAALIINIHIALRYLQSIQYIHYYHWIIMNLYCYKIMDEQAIFIYQHHLD